VGTGRPGPPPLAAALALPLAASWLLGGGAKDGPHPLCKGGPRGEENTQQQATCPPPFPWCARLLLLLLLSLSLSLLSNMAPRRATRSEVIISAARCHAMEFPDLDQTDILPQSRLDRKFWESSLINVRV
jgi:hypothetical protein